MPAPIPVHNPHSPPSPNVPASAAVTMMADGGLTPLNLLELQLVNGTRLYIADGPISVVPLLAQFDGGSMPVSPYQRPYPQVAPPSYLNDAATPVFFQPWLTKAPEFAFAGTLATATADASFQNVSGDTVNRANSLLFSTADMWGALFVYRLWQPAPENALVAVVGKVDDATVDGDNLDLTLSDFCNWSQIKAPDCTIDVSCGNIFGSPQCGSTSPMPCQNSYGSCTSLNRFKGVIVQWNSGVTSVSTATGVAQPIPPFSITICRGRCRWQI
jgi:hypothetical protein